MASEFEKQIGKIRSKLFIYCSMLEVGERRGHEDILMSGCLSREELEFVKEWDMRLMVNGHFR